MIIGERKFETITMTEFLKATRTKPDCWLFKDNGKDVQFTKSTPMPDSDEIDIYYCFFDGINTMHRFKEMDGEIWHSISYWNEQHKGFGTWQPWTGREW